MLTDFCQEFTRAKRFRDVVITAGRSRDFVFSVERIGGDRDDRDRSQSRIGFDPARGGVTVHDRHLNIHQDEVGALFQRASMIS